MRGCRWIRSDAIGRDFQNTHARRQARASGVNEGVASSSLPNRYPALPLNEVCHCLHLLGRDVDELPTIVHHALGKGCEAFSVSRGITHTHASTHTATLARRLHGFLPEMRPIASSPVTRLIASCALRPNSAASSSNTTVFWLCQSRCQAYRVSHMSTKKRKAMHARTHARARGDGVRSPADARTLM